MKRLNTSILLVFILLLQYGVSAQVSSKKLDAFFMRKMQKAGIVGMQAAFLSKGEMKWQSSYGLANYFTKKKVNDSTLFMIASCSKPVTALGILKLYEQNKLGLDDDINKYLPFSIVNPHYPNKKITIRMLLAHSASFKDNWAILDPLYTLKEGGDSPIKLGDFIKDYFLPEGSYYDSKENFFDKPPGTHWTYSNMGYALTGYLIERISGKSFETFMRDDVFVPLGMQNAYWFLREIPNENIATPHKLPEKKGHGLEPKALKHYGYPDFPDGQLRTTVTEYSKILEVLMNDGFVNGKQFLKKETIALFLSIQYPDVNKWQAIAWNYNEFDNWLYYLLMPRLPSHTGGDPGVATVVSFDPDSKTAALIFLNSPPTTFRGGKIFYLDMVKKLLKEAKRID